jgi:hypothetical protein
MVSIILVFTAFKSPSFVMTLDNTITVKYAGFCWTLGSFRGSISSAAVASWVAKV